MAKVSNCPSVNELGDLMLGMTPSGQFEELTRHLEECPVCQQVAHTLTSRDTLLEEARAGDPASMSELASRIPAAIKSQLKHLRSDASFDTQALNASGFAEPTLDDYDFLAPPQQADEIGRLGSYRVLKLLGRGGMGVVYLGHDPLLDRQVALKVMLLKLAADSGAKQRFLREARIAAKLHNDHIVTIHQVGEERGVPYLAMEFLEGSTLDKAYPPGRSPTLADVVRIGREIAKGLEAAHAKGLVHRDIKPSNIWLDDSNGGRAKILDFGLARPQEDDAHITQSGAIVGTPAFMAPEQGRGEKNVDARADLFSLGCVLYRLCVGDIPFKGETTMGVLTALAIYDPPPPHTISNAVPLPFSNLIMQLLAKDPAQRPANAREVITQLAEIERGLSEKSEPTATAVLPPASTLIGMNTISLDAVEKPSAPAASARRGPLVFAAMFVMLSLLAVGLAAYLGGIRVPDPINGGEYVIETDDPDFKFSVNKGSVILEDLKTKRRYNVKVVKADQAAGEFELDVTDIDAELSFKTKQFTIKRNNVFALSARYERTKIPAVIPPGGKIDDPKLPPETVVEPPNANRFALRFDGKNDQVGPIPVALELSQPFTIECYANAEKAASDSHLFFAINNMNLRATAGKWEFNLRGQEKNSWRAHTVASPLKLNQTSHVAGVYTGKEILLFVDGKLTASKNVEKDPPFAGTVKLSLGSGFHGILDEVRVSKGARYTKDFPPQKRFTKDADTLVLYHFDEGANDLVQDSSDNRHHAKFFGAKWWSADPDRKAAEYVLSIGGTVQLNDQAKDFKAVADLPAEPFRLTHVNLFQNERVADAGLVHFIDCKNLTTLILAGTKISDASLANFTGCTNLKVIHLYQTQVSDAGLAFFKNVKNLRDLRLHGTRVTDVGLAYFKDCKDITTLEFLSTQVGDIGMANFKDCKNLTYLGLSGTKVTDVGLANFKDCPKLTHLYLNRTNNGAGVSDVGLAHFKNCKDLTELSLAHTNVSDAGLAYFKDCKKLTYLGLKKTGVTDKSVALIRSFDKLVELKLQDTAVTPAQITVLANALPSCTIEHPLGTIAARDFDREAAETLRKYSVTLGIRFPSGAGSVAVRAWLPKEKFQLTSVDFISAKDLPKDFVASVLIPMATKLTSLNNIGHLPRSQIVTADDLNRLADSPVGKNLAVLHAEGCALTPATLAALKRFPKLTDFWCDAGDVNEDLLVRIKELPMLRDLGLYRLPVLGDGGRKALTDLPVQSLYLPQCPGIDRDFCRRLAAMPKLIGLRLSVTDVDDDCLAEFAKSTQIKTLRIHDAPITNTGLSHLAGMSNLMDFSATRSKVTEAGAKKLSDALPACQVTWEGGTIKSRDMIAAEYVVSIGGSVRVNDQFRDYTAADLPREPYRLTAVHLQKNKQITDAGLANFKGCRNIVSLNLGETKVTSADLVYFKDCKDLTFLYLANTNVNDSGMAHFKDCKDLKHLMLYRAPVGDVGLAYVKDCHNLITLDLTGTKVSNAGLAYFKNCKNLAMLSVSLTDVGDAGLDHLKDCNSLTDLRLSKNYVTKAKIDELARTLPLCKIEWNDVVLLPRDVDRAVALAVLKAGGEIYVNVGKQGVGPITSAAKLPAGPFRTTHIHFKNHAEDVGDAMLDSFKDLTQLTSLSMSSTAITNRGLALLDSPAAKDLTILVLSDTTIGDAGLVSLAKLKKLTQFRVSGCSRVGDKSLALLQGMRLVHIGLDRTAVTNNGLSYLRGMKLGQILLANCPGFDDAGLVHFKDVTTCTRIDLTQTRIGNEGLKHLMKNADLADLRVSGTRVTEAGLEGVPGLKKLEKLFIGDLPISDAFLAKLKDAKKLTTLHVHNTAITDTGLQHLKSLMLSGLNVRQTKVTAAEALKFTRANPKCAITGPGASQSFPAWAADKAAAETLRTYGATVVLTVEKNRSRITAKVPLPQGPYQLTTVDLIGTTLPADFASKVLIPALAPLTALDGINHVPLPATLTAADLNRLADGPVGSTLNLLYAHSCELTPETLAALKRFPKLTTIRIAAKTANDQLIAQFLDLPGIVDFGLTNMTQPSAGFKDKLIRPTFVSVGFVRCTTVDRDLCKQLARMPNLLNLDLGYGNIQDDCLIDLAESRTLQSLSLYGTAITDAGLERLVGLKTLRFLVIHGKVTRPGLEKFAAAMPNCKVTFDGIHLGPNFADRRAAEWVLKIGGTVRLDEHGREFTAAADLPSEPFRLTFINLNLNAQVSDTDMAYLKDCKHLIFLHLGSPRISDVGLAHLGRQTNLTHLNLANTKTSDASLANFRDCKDLIYLNLALTNVGDVGLAHFKDCKKITDLRLAGTQVTNAGLAHFKELKNLTILYVYRTAVGDAGLVHFKDCKNLQKLSLAETKVTDAGLAFFKNCKKLTSLALGNTQITHVGLAHFKGCTGIEDLTLENTKVSDAGLACFRDCKNLMQLNLDNTQATDAMLVHFKDCKNLTYLSLNGNNAISDEAFAYFKDCKNLTQLQLAGTKVGDNGLADLKAWKNLTVLNLVATNVSDGSFDHVKNCKSLTLLRLNMSRVSAMKIGELQKTLPNCRIEWDGGTIEATKR